MRVGWRLAVLTLLAAALGLSGIARADDDVCVVASNKAMAATVAATTTLVTVTKYMTTHEDWCDGNVLALEQQDGDAIDHAWSTAINAQSQCSSNAKAQEQMTKLAVSLHKRRLKISSEIAALRNKCE